MLLKALHASAEQHRLVTAERVLLEETLHGSVKALSDILALAAPAAFGRAMRAKQHATRLASRLSVPDRWQVEVAAMLSQIGCITLPAETVDKLYHGQDLREDERAMAEQLPALAEHLVASIPRLEGVRRILAYQAKHFDGQGVPRDGVHGEKIPLGARILKVVLDFDALEAQGLSAGLALDTMRGRAGHYDPEVLEAFAEVVGSATQGIEVREVRLRELRPGMVFAQDVTTRSGVLLIARGQEVNASLLQRVRNFSPHIGVIEPIRVIVPATPLPQLDSRQDSGPRQVTQAQQGR